MAANLVSGAVVGVVGAIRERERATGGHLPVIALLSMDQIPACSRVSTRLSMDNSGFEVQSHTRVSIVSAEFDEMPVPS
jgi:hypothetical protein